MTKRAMTIERLYQLRIIKSQIDFFEVPETNIDDTYIGAVDTTKPSVMSGTKTDKVADIAIESANLQQASVKEYQRLKKEYEELTKYIFHIQDEFIKAIAIRKFVAGQSYLEIAKKLYCDSSTARKALKRYIKRNP